MNMLHKHRQGRTRSALSALAFALLCACRITLAQTPSPMHLEAEDAQLLGTVFSTAHAGYLGKGYVSHFEQQSDKIVFQIPNAVKGIYDAHIRYRSPQAEKGYDLVVNGVKFSGMFARSGEAFATHNAGKVELNDGPNTLAIERGWGYFDIDALDLTPAGISIVSKPPLAPADGKATPATRALLAALIQSYGQATLSGQYEQADTDYIHAVTGQTPALFGGDLMDYSPSRLPFGAKPGDAVEKMIARAHKGQILTLSWHWNAPTGLLNKTYKTAQGKTINAAWYRGFYTDASTFDVQRALAAPDSPEYKLLLRDIDAIAVQLKKFADADVPLLWRPLHESEGGWFWWGAKGAGPFKQLWKLMYDRLTNTHHLHNLLWVFTGQKADWYPGDAVVDVVGIDAYPSDPSDPLSATWEDARARFDGKKMIALTEFGGVPDIARMRRYGVQWAYFASWTGNNGPKKVMPDVLKRLYAPSAVINEEALPITARFRAKP